MEDKIKAATGIALAGALAASAAGAQNLVQTETIVSEQRTSVSVRIAPEAAQAFLPAGWTPATPTLNVIFMDRTLQLTPDGKLLGLGANQVLVLVIAARNAATGETRSMVVGGFSSDPAGTPGAYKVYGSGSVSLRRSEEKSVKDGKVETRVEEHWAALGADGSSVNLDLAFTRGVPNPSDLNVRVYSAAEPDFYRIYRGQQAGEVLRGGQGGADKVQSISLTATGGKLGRAIDGTHQIATVTSTPFYTRQTFVEQK